MQAMSRGHKCSICARTADVEAINAQLRAGLFQNDIAQQFQVSRFVVSRHARKCLTAAVAPIPESNAATLEAQAAVWLARADAIYELATATQDIRGQVQAVTSAFRGLELQHRAEKTETTAADAPSTGEVVTIEKMDEIIRRIELGETAETQLIYQIVQALKSAVTYSGSPVVLALIEQLLGATEPALLPDFLAFKARRIQEGDRSDLPRRNDEHFSQNGIAN
jgi:hypothetical protein